MAALSAQKATLAAGAGDRALLKFDTPFLLRETVTLEDGRQQRLFLAGGELPLGKILGNVAYELTAWDIEDRDVGDGCDRARRHDLARQARRAAEAACADLAVTRCELAPVAVGERQAKTDGRFYFLGGFVGEVELAGELDAALPWLAALSLGRGGQKRGMGFGAVRLWLGGAWQ